MDHNQVSDSWVHGDTYERYVGRWSRQVAPRFLTWLDAPPGQRWLDVGCGTGALSAAILEFCALQSLAGVEPSEGFLQAARRNLAGRVSLYQGSAAEIPLEDSAVDLTVSGLVLNFTPNPQSALIEMRRVTVGGGCIGAYVWDYAGKMEFMRFFWDAAIELDPQAARLDEGQRFPLCNSEGLMELFAAASLEGVVVKAIDIPTPFASFADYWEPFLGGQGPAPAYVMALDAAARARLRDRLRERLPAQADGSIALIARAWAVRGTVAK